MNRQKYFNYINRQLSSLEINIKQSGKLNLTDIHINSEHFFRDLLNLIDNTKFINLNHQKTNYPAVDLIDEKQKRIIQISANATKQKIIETLNKKIMQTYANQGYTLEFLFIEFDCQKLKIGAYENAYQIKFDPKVNIISLADLVKKIFLLKIEILEKVYSLFKKEFGNKSEITFLPSLLSEILWLLSQRDLTMLDNDFDLRQFKIEAKIEFNNLDGIKDSVINQNKIYFGQVDKIYQQFDQQGHNKRLVVFQKIKKFYYQQTKNREINNVQKFKNIVESIKNLVKNSQNCPEITEEELEFYCEMIVVHAFIECQIFEKPEKS